MLGTSALLGNQVGSNEPIEPKFCKAASGGTTFTLEGKDREIIVDSSVGVVTLKMPPTVEMNGNVYTVWLKAGGNNCAFSFGDTPLGYAAVQTDRDLDATDDRICFLVLNNIVWVIAYVQA